MATQNDFSRAFPASVPMSAWRRVSCTSTGAIAYANATDPGVGVLQEDVLGGTTYENPKVRFYGTGSVMVAVTGGVATPGNTAYTAVTGYVSAATSSGSITFGIFLTAATPNGTVAEVLPALQF